MHYIDTIILEPFETEESDVRVNRASTESNVSNIKILKTNDKTILESKEDIFIFKDPVTPNTKMNLTQILTDFKVEDEGELKNNVFLQPKKDKTSNNIKQTLPLNNQPQTMIPKIKKSNSIIITTLMLLILSSVIFILQETSLVDFKSIASQFKSNSPQTTKANTYSMDVIFHEWNDLFYNAKKL